MEGPLGEFWHGWNVELDNREIKVRPNTQILMQRGEIVGRKVGSI